jgi:hypothetical protein
MEEALAAFMASGEYGEFLPGAGGERGRLVADGQRQAGGQGDEARPAEAGRHVPVLEAFATS